MLLNVIVLHVKVFVRQGAAFCLSSVIKAVFCVWLALTLQFKDCTTALVFSSRFASSTGATCQHQLAGCANTPATCAHAGQRLTPPITRHSFSGHTTLE